MLELLFIEGKVVVIILGLWNVEVFLKVGINYGIMKLLELENGKNMSVFIGVKSYNVSVFLKNVELV